MQTLQAKLVYFCNIYFKIKMFTDGEAGED